MGDRIRVVVLGTGQMGSGMIKLLLEKEGVDLVGVYGRRAERAGTDVGDAVGLGRSIGVSLSSDLPKLLEETQPHIVLQATCSKVVDAVEEILVILHHGANVVSIAEEMSYPAYESPQAAQEIHAMALEKGLTVVAVSYTHLTLPTN